MITFSDDQPGFDFTDHPADDGKTDKDSLQGVLAGFDKKQEIIPRQIGVIHPSRTIWGYTQHSLVSSQIEEKKRRLFETGVKGFIENEKQLQELTSKVALLRYGVEHCLFHDLGAGLYSALTAPHSDIHFADVRPLIDGKTGQTIKTAITLSEEGIYKLTLGPLVNENGRGVAGCGPVVKELKDRIRAILNGLEGEPYALASLNIPSQNGNEEIRAAIFEKPIIISAQGNGGYQIQLSNYFYPVKTDNEQMKAKELFIHSVAGLHSVLAFGRYLETQRGEKGLPQAREAHRAILHLQAGYEMRAFAPDLVKRQGQDRVNIMFRRRPTIKELRPGAIEPSGRINYAEVSRFMANAGTMYARAVYELGILPELNADILVPATFKGAEFPDTEAGGRGKEIVYLKADTVRKAVKELRK